MNSMKRNVERLVIPPANSIAWRTAQYITVDGTLRNTGDQKLVDESIVLSKAPIKYTTIKRGIEYEKSGPPLYNVNW
ncbi:hypothetical protein J6590_090394 [Homalodisca vitripennis]|nr:hypothetical protein J6590_090394 [Homalodisca vitripennis]